MLYSEFAPLTRDVTGTEKIWVIRNGQRNRLVKSIGVVKYIKETLLTIKKMSFLVLQFYS